MKLEILAHPNTKRERISYIRKASKFFLKELNIDTYSYKIFVLVAPHLIKNDNSNGYATKTGSREVTIVLDSSLDMVEILFTLAHEMVHAKQFVRGQYRSEKARNGRYLRYWMGKRVNVDYINQPWEREAFRRQGDLVESFVMEVSKKKARLDK